MDLPLDNSDGLVNLHNLAKQLNSFPEDKTVPIVLVPGFSGWGSPLFGAVNYWGGVENIPQRLVERGYTVIVTPIGPVSTNWERACELYRQLTFGKFSSFNPSTSEIEEIHDVTVDYGNYFDSDSSGPSTAITSGRKRAILFSQSPKEYDDWKWSEDHKVHFICHSQGGNTVRYLISLMKLGARDVHSEYFGAEGRDTWTVSVTTVGTPHKGTTIIDVLQNFISNSTDQAIKLLARTFAVVSFQSPKQRAYDLQLDHWDICRQGRESFQEMRQRLESNDGPVSKWFKSNHNGFYDNSIKGVSDLNKRAIPTSTHVYYFSLSFHSTISFPCQWPPWTAEALNTFPIALVDFVRRIPLVNGIVDVVAKVGWPFILSLVKFHDVVRWATEAVANRLLREINYNVTVPPPGKYLPRKDVFPLMLPTVYGMGGLDLGDDQKEILGENLGDWYLNDGIVNTESMRGPDDSLVKSISGFPTSTLDGDGLRGVYWHFGVNDQMDHVDEIGVFIEEYTAQCTREMYFNLATIVSRLPY
ncbi:Alpha/Beta hydrolase protein [Lipomyces tetrasporus]